MMHKIGTPANVLTAIRLFGGTSLLFLPTPSHLFQAIFLFGGLTDALDGPVARKTGKESTYGEKLDTMADLVFFLIGMFRILPTIDFPKVFWGFLLLLSSLKAFRMIYFAVKNKELLSLHLPENKAAGAACYLTLAVLLFFPYPCLVWPACSLSLCAFCTEGITVYGGFWMKHKKQSVETTKKLFIAIGIPLELLEIASIVFFFFTRIWWPFVLVIAIELPVGLLAIRYYRENMAFRCGSCGHVFQPSFWTIFSHPKAGTERKLRCPSCNQVTTCTQTPKNEP